MQFKDLQDRFPDDKLELQHGKVYLNDIPSSIVWPTEKFINQLQTLHGLEIERSLLDTLTNEVKFVKDIRTIGYKEALEQHKKRIEDWSNAR